MVMLVNANITALLEAITAADEARIIQETLQLLGPEKVPPAKIAARVGIPAAWGGGDGEPLSVLAVAGRVAEWMRAIPIGPEPGAETRRALAPALPLVQGFMAVADRVRQGLPEPHPTLPEPILPADVRHADGPLGALREAVATRDVASARAVLMGYYATGTDYRELLTTIYAALSLRYPAGGRSLRHAVAGTRVLDMADWGDRAPAYIYWVTPLLLDDSGDDTPIAQAARAYAASPEHDLAWVRTRLSIPKEEAAGQSFQQALIAGDAQAACDATLRALRDGATPIGVAAGIALAAASQVNAVAQGDNAGLVRAAQVLQYAHSVHVVTLHTQNAEVWPLLYTAACAVNSIRAQGNGAAIAQPARLPASATLGGLIPASMLRTLEQQVTQGDTVGALASTQRYIQMGHPTRALAGILGSVAASRDAQSSDAPEATVAVLPVVAAAAEEYLTLPRALQGNGVNPLLTAAIRLASELSTEHRLADRVRLAIDARS